METASRKIARLDRSIARAGETVTLQRTAVDGSTGGVTVALELSAVPAHVRASQPQDLIDPDAKEMRVVLSPTQLLATTLGSPAVAFGIPARDDKVLIQGDPSNVQQVDPIYYGGSLVRINLLCRG
jgi:hypothetical protein